MLFNSFEYLVFLPIVFVFYWFIVNKSPKEQNVLLLIASYFFYAWWDLRFLSLLVILSLINYSIGIKIESNNTNKYGKKWLLLGLTINIVVLGVFKYFNFFIGSFVDFAALFGYDLPRTTTSIILPLGISFYVFLSLSYIIDIYKKNLAANRNIFEVLLALSFFPIILAGPIQRPITLLPQISKTRVFNYDLAKNGLRQILWGLFTKVVIADQLARYVDKSFSGISEYSGSTLLLGIVYFSIQIYADFSGYSNMAIGTAKLFGFTLMQNFAYPYFSRDIAEFWKRWHISLTTWFRDYLFLPISFSISWRLKSKTVLLIKSDLFIYFVASAVTWFLTGLWHGPKYTFILWGLIHGLALIIYQWQKTPRKRLLKSIGTNNNNYLIVIVETITTLIIVMTAWVFFRANDLQEAFSYLDGVFSISLLSIPDFLKQEMGLIVASFSLIFLSTEWIGRKEEYALANLETKMGSLPRWAMYFTLITIIYFLGSKDQQFIYFQF